MACLFQYLLYLCVSLWRIKRERASLWSRLSLGVSVTPCSMKNSRTRGKEGMGNTDRQNIEPRRHIKSSSHTLFTLLRTRHHHLLMEKGIFFKKKARGGHLLSGPPLVEEASAAFLFDGAPPFSVLSSLSEKASYTRSVRPHTLVA